MDTEAKERKPLWAKLFLGGIAVFSVLTIIGLVAPEPEPKVRIGNAELFEIKFVLGRDELPCGKVIDAAQGLNPNRYTVICENNKVYKLEADQNGSMRVIK